MKEKWLNLEIFPKSILVSLIFTLLMLSIGSILLVVDTSYLYGVLVGTGILYLSYFIIWILWYKIPAIKSAMSKTTAILSPTIRIVVYIISLLLIVFFIGEGQGLDRFVQPINTIMMLITYTLTLFSYGTVIVIDKILENKQKQKEV